MRVLGERVAGSIVERDTYADIRVAINLVFHDRAHPSRIMLPGWEEQ
ncbi:MAG: hypothetical protein NQU46_03080 [Methanolinea sp.]|nr:hypothetical protein [Methanolinea sp.]